MDDYFFSERESGARPPVEDELDQTAWGGLVALLLSQLAKQSFAMAFPALCTDKERGVVATDEASFWLALKANVPDAPERLEARDVPSAYVAMDVLEFLSMNVAEASEGSYHDFFAHRHLHFNEVTGVANLRTEANRIFRRSGLAFEMNAQGRVMHIPPPVVRERLEKVLPATGRASLDERLAKAVERYRSPDPSERMESLEKLWDAWEEIKTIRGEKPTGIRLLIGEVTAEPTYWAALDEDALALTKLGNKLQIRHSEVGRVEIQDEAQVDYLFGRLFNLIWLLLRA